MTGAPRKDVQNEARGVKPLGCLLKIVLWPLALAAAAIGIAVLHWVWQPLGEALRNEVTVYPAMRTPQGLLPLNRSTYKAFPESQSVIHWMPDLSGTPDRLARCAVRDRLNWQCEYSDGSAALHMTDGELKIEDRSGVPEPTMYIGRLRWQYCSWTGRC